MKARHAFVGVLLSAILGTLLAIAVLPGLNHAAARGVAYASDSAVSLAANTADENQVQKGVPIISLGSGLRVGVALVTGPSSQVDKVKVVAQVDLNFKGFARIRAFVPVETENLKQLRRVPQTSVTGLADLRL